MIGIPIYIPCNAFYDNDSIYKNVLFDDSELKKENLNQYIYTGWGRELLPINLFLKSDYIVQLGIFSN